MILELVQEAFSSGARLEKVAEIIGLSERTLQRWREQCGGQDARNGPSNEPANKLTAAERQLIVQVANLPEYRDQSPKQIVPRLADQGTYIASESTFYRVLHQAGQQNHREPSKPAVSKRPAEQVATGPCQVWSWDITYLKSNVRGQFYYLYMFMDVWSRKIVAATVFDREDSIYSSWLFNQTCVNIGIDPQGLVLHSDNGAPMKGATMLATLQKLGVVPSFSRPRVSDDNPYSESLFRTMKYRPEYPGHPFASVDNAQQWVDGFVRWYNTEHLHSQIGFVTPNDRHCGRHVSIQENRRQVYENARRRNPIRWSRSIRKWDDAKVVRLNPEHGCCQHKQLSVKKAA
jgi:putative transposase